MSRRHATVLVPTDFSPGATAALERTLRLPLATGAKIVLLHVLPGDVPDQVRGQVEDEARASMANAIAEATNRHGFEIVSELAAGSGYEQIIARARALDAGLIVIGRHGRRAIRDLFIGSTAERTVRYGDVPVLIVNQRPDHPYRKPLIALDLGDTAKRVADLALGVIEPDLDVDLLHVYRIPYEGLYDSSLMIREIEATASAAMSKLIASLGDEHARWHPIVRRGDTRTTILSEAVARESDLIAVGTHGRSGLARVLVGSVAEWVIAQAACDVLVTRPTRFSFELP